MGSRRALKNIFQKNLGNPKVTLYLWVTLKLLIMTDHIHHKVFFSHSPEDVWEYLTKPDLIAQWLMENDFQPIIGFDFQFRTRPMPNLDFDGIVYCKVVEIVPYKKLSYSWKGGPGNGRITLESLVAWTL